MKYLRRYLSLLFALVMCVGLFSVTAHAEETSLSPLYVEVSHEINYEGGDYSYGHTEPFWGSDEENPLLDYTENAPNVGGTHEYLMHYYVMPEQGIIMPSKNQNCLVKIENVYFSLLAYNGSYQYFSTPSSVNAVIYYTNQTSETIRVTDFNSSGFISNFQFEFEPKHDVQAIELLIVTNFNYDFGSRGSVTFYYDAHATLKVDVPTKQETLLSGILDKIKDGFQNVKDGFQNIKNSLSNIVSSITELPQKIWEKISDGLKSLFVPSEESMTAYKDKWDELLASRFGAVYQVCEIVTDSWSEIGNADTTDTINFPSVTIPLPDDAQFTFGGYEVKIIPEGFDVIVQAVKLIVGIVCTLAFINGMLKRYDELMGVEQ